MTQSGLEVSRVTATRLRASIMCMTAVGQHVARHRPEVQRGEDLRPRAPLAAEHDVDVLLADAVLLGKGGLAAGAAHRGVEHADERMAVDDHQRSPCIASDTRPMFVSNRVAICCRGMVGWR